MSTTKVKTTKIPYQQLVNKADPRTDKTDPPVTYVFGAGKKVFKQKPSGPY